MRKNYGFQRKIYLMFTLIVTVTVLLLTVFFSYYIRKLSVEKMVEQYENLTQQFFEEFMGYYNKMDGNIDNFITNDYVQKTLTNGEMHAFDREMVVQALTFLGNDTDYYVYIDNYSRYLCVQNWPD